jgi:polyisoprenoid-binding protein YceI
VRFRIGFLVWRVVRGSFADLSGSITDCEDAGRCAGELVIPVATISTGNRLRDRHLRSTHYLDQRRFPRIVFRAMTVRFDGGRTIVAGTLTIRDVTEPLEIEVTRARARITSPARDDRVRLRGAARIDRSVFGVRGTGILRFADRLIARIVHCEIDLEAMQTGA